MRTADLTVERLKSLLHYDPLSGLFTWLVSPSSQVRAGDIAGSIDRRHGYICIGIDGRLHFAHRLAWLYMTGEWPRLRVDHRNTVTGDNRFDNLRDVSQGVNLQNQRRPRSTNPYLGVAWDKSRGKWVAHIKVDGRQRFLGRFDDPMLGHEAYLAAKREHHEGNTL
jgi:hypothetical protein